MIEPQLAIAGIRIVVCDGAAMRHVGDGKSPVVTLTRAGAAKGALLAGHYSRQASKV